jgi:hypothetical protein
MKQLVRILLVLLMTALIGAGILAAVWQFNDGKISRGEYGFILVGMGMPNLFVAGVLRVFRHRVGFYFLWVGLACLVIGLFTMWSTTW